MYSLLVYLKVQVYLTLKFDRPDEDYVFLLAQKVRCWDRRFCTQKISPAILFSEISQ